jgi:TRAP-type C4-dicarboxylate transport system permease small subunit
VSSLRPARNAFERLLEWIVIALVLALTVLIICGFIFRYLGRSLVWYDEMASIGLVWLTYYGSALAALKGSHIGVPELVNAMPPRWRVVVTILAEALVILFFSVLAYTGFEVLAILANDRMVSLPAVPLRITQSAVPIAAILFIIAELLRLPQRLADARGAGFVDPELKEALEQAGIAEQGASASLTGERP